MAETLTDFKEQDNYDSKLYSNEDDALKEFYAKADEIVITVQHCIDDDSSRLHINDVLEVSKAAHKILKLALFDYEIEVDGKYQTYELTLEYDFTSQAKKLMLEEFGLSRYVGEYA